MDACGEVFLGEYSGTGRYFEGNTGGLGTCREAGHNW